MSCYELFLFLKSARRRRNHHATWAQTGQHTEQRQSQQLKANHLFSSKRCDSRKSRGLGERMPFMTRGPIISKLYCEYYCGYSQSWEQTAMGNHNVTTADMWPKIVEHDRPELFRPTSANRTSRSDQSDTSRTGTSKTSQPSTNQPIAAT
eukprot:g39681.t1